MASDDGNDGDDSPPPAAGAILRGEDYATILPATAVSGGADPLLVSLGFAQARADALQENLRASIVAHAGTRRRLAEVERRLGGVRGGKGLLDPDMPVDAMLLHMGEMTVEEVLCVRAAIRWANSVAVRSSTDERGHDPGDVARVDPDEPDLR